jgi:hypothetical protein
MWIWIMYLNSFLAAYKLLTHFFILNFNNTVSKQRNKNIEKAQLLMHSAVADKLIMYPGPWAE